MKTPGMVPSLIIIRYTVTMRLVQRIELALPWSYGSVRLRTFADSTTSVALKAMEAVSIEACRARIPGVCSIERSCSANCL